MMQATRSLRIAVALALAGIAGAAAPATLTDRTTMPDFCSERDVNCVLPDGTPPPARAGVPGVTQPPAATTPQPVPSTSTLRQGANIGARRLGSEVVVIPPADPSGVTTVITPPVGTTVITPPAGATTGGTAAGGTTAAPSVPAVPALSGALPALPGQVPALPGQVPSLTTGGTASGTTSSTTAGGTASGTTAGSPASGSGSASGGGSLSGSGARGGGMGARSR